MCNHDATSIFKKGLSVCLLLCPSVRQSRWFGLRNFHISPVLVAEQNFTLKLFGLRNFPLWLFQYSIFQISIFIFVFNDHSLLLLDQSMYWIRLRNFFEFEIFHFYFDYFDYFDVWFFKFRFSFSSSMTIQCYWWIIQYSECRTQARAVGLVCAWYLRLTFWTLTFSSLIFARFYLSNFDFDFLLHWLSFNIIDGSQRMRYCCCAWSIT